MAVEGNQQVRQNHKYLNINPKKNSFQFTLAANSLDEKLLLDSAKIGSRIENFNVKSTPIRYTNFVTEDLALKIDDFAVNSAILVGLHCCGDFSSTILKVFQKSEKSKALVLFGCCYHKEFQCFHFLRPENNENEREISENVGFKKLFKK